MKITIFQINMGRDRNRVAFLSFDALKRFQHTSEVDSEIYDKVFEGEVNCENLEDVYHMFNTETPKGYIGRSLSISDVVGVIGADGKSTYNFCDTVGFKKVDFDAGLAKEPYVAKIKVVFCEPGKVAEVREIANTLTDLQSVVKGDIERFYPFEEAVCLACNEEGKFNGMDFNRAVYGKDHEIIDVICGPFFICDCSGQNFGSLNREQLERYEKMFHLPEKFVTVNGKIVSEPFIP